MIASTSLPQASFVLKIACKSTTAAPNYILCRDTKKKLKPFYCEGNPHSQFLPLLKRIYKVHVQLFTAKKIKKKQLRKIVNP
jgi:hypothetical protein